MQSNTARCLVTITCGAMMIAGGCASPSQGVGAPATGHDGAVPLVSGPAPVAEARIAALRAMGPAGLRELLTEHDEAQARGADEAALAPLRRAIDRVAAQHDAWASRLYWYTDLEQAKLAARLTGRPILSLHLLGALDEELSCANSRLFRLALYPNRALARVLEERFVLHWVSERPVPKITVDFSDGRSIVRTITGNSIHYVLDARGRPIDGIPGLYGPGAFAAALERSLPFARRAGAMDDDEYGKALVAYHAGELTRLTREFREELEATGVAHDVAASSSLPTAPSAGAAAARVGGPAAIWAEELTVGKSQIERPLVRALQPTLYVAAVPFDVAPMLALSKRHAGESALDDASKALIASQHPRAWGLPGAPTLTAEALAAREQELERSLALDGARNEYGLHGQIHAWLGRAEGPHDLAALDAYVYTALFATPPRDEWLGLASVDVLTGLADDGLVTTRPRPAGE